MVAPKLPYSKYKILTTYISVNSYFLQSKFSELVCFKVKFIFIIYCVVVAKSR